MYEILQISQNFTWKANGKPEIDLISQCKKSISHGIAEESVLLLCYLQYIFF